MIDQALAFLQNVIVPIVIFVVLPVFFWFQRDRRKTLAETAVAERTVGVDVNAKEAGALGASVAFVQEAFRVERESKDRQIATLEDEVQELREKISDRDEKISALSREVAELKDAVSLLKRMTEKFTQSEDAL